MSRDWDHLYTLQDQVLSQLTGVDQGFYLSGGTGLARGYYQHRYSEDLDFFVNDLPDFELWRDRCLDRLQKVEETMNAQLEIVLREKRFGRAILHQTVSLKLEFINDVPFRVGKPWRHPTLGMLDTRENILANKISALVDRGEPKDLADIYWLCCRDGLNLPQAIEQAEGKAAGIFPPLVAEALDVGARAGVPKVFWRQPPSESEFRTGMTRLVSDIMR